MQNPSLLLSLEWLADLLIMDESSGRAMAHNLNI
jgi:predicted nucleic acid-binding protein